MYVIVWSENDIVGPFATKAQARKALQPGGQKLSDLELDTFICKVRTPDSKEYSKSTHLVAEMIRDD